MIYIVYQYILDYENNTYVINVQSTEEIGLDWVFFGVVM